MERGCANVYVLEGGGLWPEQFSGGCLENELAWGRLETLGLFGE